MRMKNIKYFKKLIIHLKIKISLKIDEITQIMFLLKNLIIARYTLISKLIAYLIETGERKFVVSYVCKTKTHIRVTIGTCV